MKLAVMQPYFFPYLGYFSLIEYSDRFVFFDTPQYIRHGWMNRNRIIDLTKDYRYITIPVDKHPQNMPANKITICKGDWKRKIIGQIESAYKKSAPYYDKTMELVSSCFVKEHTHLTQINIESTLKVCEFIGLSINYSVFSQMELEIEPVYEPDEWALNIAVAMGYNIYCNATGGQNFFDRNKYQSKGIVLEFIKNRLSLYKQGQKEFVHGLSIIDVLMWNSPNETMELIKNYDVIVGSGDRCCNQITNQMK